MNELQAYFSYVYFILFHMCIQTQVYTLEI